MELDTGAADALEPDLSETLKLIDSCRYIRAKRLFDALLEKHKLNRDWLPRDESVAAKISQMILRENECVQVIRDMETSPFDESKGGWILGSTHFGITTHYKLAEDGIIEVRMEGNMVDLPLFEQAAVIHEVDLFKTWIPFCNDSKAVGKIGYADIVAYISIWIPPVGRDTLIYAYAADCLHESNKILLSGKSIDSWKNTTTKSAGWFSDRMEVQKFLATIDVTSSNSAKTCIMAKVDPRIILPQSIINIVIRNLAGFMLYFFQQKVKDVVKHSDSEHAKRIIENPHFYREWLLPKFNEYCASKSWDKPKIPYWETNEKNDREVCATDS